MVFEGPRSPKGKGFLITPDRSAVHRRRRCTPGPAGLARPRFPRPASSSRAVTPREGHMDGLDAAAAALRFTGERTGGLHDDHPAPRRRPGPRRPRLARHPPHLLLRRLPRPARTWASARCASSTRTGSRPARGFGTHPHRDMEIITYVLEGALAHQDSHGQRLGHPAGRGAAHERRHRRARTASATPPPTEPVHLLQIWLLPAQPRPHAELRAEELSRGRAAGRAPAGGRPRRRRAGP